MQLRKYATKVLKATNSTAEYSGNLNPHSKVIVKQRVPSGDLSLGHLERPYENAAEKRFIQELFPEYPPLSDKIKIIYSKKASIADLNGTGSVQALSAVKLQNQFAQMYAALETGEVDVAESLFHRAWRSNRNQVKLMTSREMCNRFIDVLLERQTAEIKKGLGTFNNSWEGRAIDWRSNMERLYECMPNLHSYCLFLRFYLQMNEIEKSKNILDKIEKNFSALTSEPTFSSSKLGEYLAADSCFADNSMKLEILNDFLVSCGHGPLSKFADNSIGDLLLSALEESPSLGGKKQNMYVKEEENESLKKIQLETTETIGVNILLSILKSKESIAGMDKYNQQLWLESRALTAAQDQFEQEQKRMPKELRKLSRLPHDLISNWHQALQSEIKNTIENPTKKDQSIIPFLKLVSPDIVCRIVIASILRLPHRKNHDESPEKALTRFGQFSLIELAQLIGNSVQREHNLQQLNSKKNQKKLNLQKSIQKIHANGKLFNMAVRRAVLELKRREDAKVETWNPDWGMEVITIVGSYLIDKAIQVCMIPIQTPSDIKGEFKEDLVPALQHSLEWKAGKKYGVIKLHSFLYDLISSSSIYVAPWSLPMLVKPLPWLHSRAGGYLQHRFSAVRTSFNQEHDEYIKAADEAEHLSTVLHSLDVLGSTGWIINEKIFTVAAHFWNTKENISGICSPVNPPEIEIPSEMKIKGAEVDIKIKKAYEKECQKRETMISNAFSERCSTNYKLEIARAFLGETIYFPHNVDFRGRAYPIPPNLNHMGDDLCRGLLKFSEKRPLGERGLWWLKIHISNLYGFDKAPLEERFAFTENNLDHILDSAQNPVEGNRWWLKADKPWQLLAVCIELSDALKTSDPAAYMSNIPIHQDGSCNGLQHYAALGGDELGATAVNLAPADRPDDIYTKIAKQVQILIDEDVEKGIPEALLMQKRVNRKLVKQSVMTNTYGVTFIGAREQIKNRLKEARDNESPATALTDEQLKTCAAYSARLVFKSMDHMFEGARELQLWLNRAASLVTKSLSKEAIENENLQFYDELIKEGIISKNEKYLSSENDDDSDLLMDAVAQDTQSALKSAKKNEEEEYDDTFEDRAPVTIKKKKPARMTSMIWTSPLGMPIVQPYRKEFISQVKTHLQSLSIPSTKTGPVNSAKQSSAFPPNFVHSLDACHMMLSAIACESQKIVFAAVHDSYWTHACDIDRMSKILRECFIRLHSQDIMGRLREELLARFSENRLAEEIVLKPEDLEKVKEIAKRVGITTRFNKRSKSITVYSPFTLPPLPKKGSFDIKQVAKSTYFFH